MASPSHLVLYNTLTRKAEAFRPRDPRRITFYTCGPTVYDDAHIGNFRSFLAADVLRRFLESPLCRLVNDGEVAPAAPEHGLQARATARTVVHVMNITDVGHMTDDDAADGGGEDKMQAATRRLAEAKKAGKLPAGAGDIDPSDQHAIARFYEARFKEDARRLGLKVAIEAHDRAADGSPKKGDPTLMPRATEAVPGMIAVIKRLTERTGAGGRAFAYAVGPAGRQTVYFSVESFPRYGSLSGNTLDALRSGEGGRVQESHQAEKRHPADFLLWKSDPTHAMRWPSPWGEGYPGWHIECSAMSAMRLCAAEGEGPLSADALLGLTTPDGLPLIDLHSGGEDNIFPHHECEIAQSCCAFNAEPGEASPEHGMYAAHWFHPRFLMVEGAKMSKSKGNFFTARDLFAKGHEPAAVRLELIKTHYRSNANFTEQGLRDSGRMYWRWLIRVWSLMRLEDINASEPGSLARSDHARQRVDEGAERFRAAMANDLNVASAIAIVEECIGDASKAVGFHYSGEERLRPSPSDLLARIRSVVEPRPMHLALQRIVDMLEVLGLTDCDDPPAAASTDIGIFIPPAAPTPEITALLEQRRAARAAKDFKASDAIRDQLAAMGYAIKDAPGGKVEVRKA